MCGMNVADADINIPDDVVIHDVAVPDEDEQDSIAKVCNVDDYEKEYEVEWDCCKAIVATNKSNVTSFAGSIHEAKQLREMPMHCFPV